MDIFLVAVYKHDELIGMKRPRTWGWYQKFEDAERAVLENHTDIFEINYYDRAVIERIPEGVMAIAEDVAWYRADFNVDADGRYDPIVVKVEKPEWSKSFFNFTM